MSELKGDAGRIVESADRVEEYGGTSMHEISFQLTKTAGRSVMTRFNIRLKLLFHAVALSGSLGLGTSVSHAAEESGPGAPPEPRIYYVQDIKAAVTKHIENAVDEQGVFHMHDEKTGEYLKLKFVQVHDPVRQIGSDVYFACTDFHVLGEPKKLYDLDFWMKESTGELKVFESKVHKEPRWSLVYGWYKQPRYTFVDDRIKYLY